LKKYEDDKAIENAERAKIDKEAKEKEDKEVKAKKEADKRKEV